MTDTSRLCQKSNSKASLTQLSRTYGINPKTVQKWRKRETVKIARQGRNIRTRRFWARLKKRSSWPSAVTLCDD